MALTELMVKQAKPEEKTYTMSDAHGLMLEVRPNGRKYWILRIFIRNKESRRSLGAYPEMSLRDVREKARILREQIKSGEEHRLEIFNAVYEEFLEKRCVGRLKEAYIRVVNLRFKKYISPAIGNMKMTEIKSSDILRICRRIESIGIVETAHRVRQIIGQVFRFAIAAGYADNDPSLALHGALQTPRGKHFATITEPEKIALLMSNIRGYPFILMRQALLFSALTFCRPGEIRHAEWSEIDLVKNEWRIPAEKMKMKRIHVVPLAIQTLDLLADLRDLTGNQRWLFPSPRRDGNSMSENGVRVALRSMGYGNDDMTAHGFRAMASTILNENGFVPDVIERQLAHAEGNKIRAAYNHAEYLPERRKMMQWWADWLDEICLSV